MFSLIRNSPSALPIPLTHLWPFSLSHLLPALHPGNVQSLCETHTLKDFLSWADSRHGSVCNSTSQVCKSELLTPLPQVTIQHFIPEALKNVYLT